MAIMKLINQQSLNHGILV